MQKAPYGDLSESFIALSWQVTAVKSLKKCFEFFWTSTDQKQIIFLTVCHFKRWQYHRFYYCNQY